jgi:hypothetical protein
MHGSSTACEMNRSRGGEGRVRRWEHIMAEGIEGNGYVDPASVEASPLAPAGFPPMAEIPQPLADPGRDILAIVQQAERAAVRRFAYPFVRLVADEA